MAEEITEEEEEGERSKKVRKALFLVEEAIKILDLVEAPGDIAAHLDMGRHRLEAFLHE